MGKSIFAAIMVLCGAFLGCLAYGAAFGVVSASMLEPSLHRGALFGLTFGAVAGATIGLFSVDADSGRGFLAKAIPRLTGFAIVAFAANALFWDGGWDIVFEGSRGLALASIVIWAGTATWLTREIAW